MRLIKLFLCGVMLCSAGRAFCQGYVYATGVPTFSTTLPIDHGIVNVNNGDIHLEIPLATNAQRGRLGLEEKLVYDSRIWQIVQNGSGYIWQPNNVPNSMGGLDILIRVWRRNDQLLFTERVGTVSRLSNT
jgi:hypothetical protein